MQQVLVGIGCNFHKGFANGHCGHCSHAVHLVPPCAWCIRAVLTCTQYIPDTLHPYCPSSASLHLVRHCTQCIYAIPHPIQCTHTPGVSTLWLHTCGATPSHLHLLDGAAYPAIPIHKSGHLLMWRSLGTGLRVSHANTSRSVLGLWARGGQPQTLQGSSKGQPLLGSCKT